MDLFELIALLEEYTDNEKRIIGTTGFGNITRDVAVVDLNGLVDKLEKDGEIDFLEFTKVDELMDKAREEGKDE